jgi:hypothetical protein
VFAKTLNLGFVAEMGHRDLNEKIITERANIEIGNDLLRVGVFKVEEFHLNLLTRFRHDPLALIECKSLRQKHCRIDAKHFLGKHVQDRFGTATARLAAMMREVRNLVFILQPCDQIPLTCRADAPAGKAPQDFGDMRQRATGSPPIDKLSTVGTVRFPSLFVLVHSRTRSNVRVESGEVKTIHTCPYLSNLPDRPHLPEWKAAVEVSPRSVAAI